MQLNISYTCVVSPRAGIVLIVAVVEPLGQAVSGLTGMNIRIIRSGAGGILAFRFVGSQCNAISRRPGWRRVVVRPRPGRFARRRVTDPACQAVRRPVDVPFDVVSPRAGILVAVVAAQPAGDSVAGGLHLRGFHVRGVCPRAGILVATEAAPAPRDRVRGALAVWFRVVRPGAGLVLLVERFQPGADGVHGCLVFYKSVFDRVRPRPGVVVPVIHACEFFSACSSSSYSLTLNFSSTLMIKRSFVFRIHGKAFFYCFWESRRTTSAPVESCLSQWIIATAS